MKSEDKKQKILVVASEMFMNYGLRAVSMDDIARKNGISKKTLYELFKDKADLIENIVEIESKKVSDNFQKAFSVDDNAIDKMLKINRKLIELWNSTPQNIYFELNKYYPDILEKTKKSSEKRMFEAVKETHKQGQKDGLIRTNIDLDIIAALLVGRSKIIDFLMDLSNKDYETLLNEIFDYHIRAVATEKGLIYYENLKNEKK